MQNLFSFQTPSKFRKFIQLALEIYQLVQETVFHFALKEKDKKRGKDCLAMIDNKGNYLEQ